MKAAYVTPYTTGGVSRLKTPLLYFDKLIIQDREILEVETGMGMGTDGTPLARITEVHSIVGNYFRGEVSSLIKEGVLEIERAKNNRNQAAIQDYVSKTQAAHDALMTVAEGTKVTFRESDDQFELLERFQATVAVGSYTDFGFLFTYYGGLLADAAQWAEKRIPVVSGSESLYKIIQSATVEGILGTEHMKNFLRRIAEPLLVNEIVSEAIIDVSSLEFDDILEARLKFNAEFVELQGALDRISFDLVHKYGSAEVIREGRRIASAAIRPPLRQIESAIRASNLGVMKKLCDVLKSPRSYVPLLGTLFTLPLEIALLVSIGVMTIETAMEYIDSRREVTQDPLYFLVLQRELAALRAREAPREVVSESEDKPRRTENRMTYYVWPELARRAAPPKS